MVILVVVRELFRLGLDVMEPFSCSYSLCLAREKVVVVPVFNRVRKDWFDVCLCLWIVKIVVLTGLDISMSSRDIFCFYGMSLRRSGVGFSRLAMILSSHQLCSDSAQNMMKPTAPQVVRNMSGASISSFSSAAPWWLCQLLPAWPTVWLWCCLRCRKRLPLFPLSSTCRNRTIGQCSTLPWKCRGFSFLACFVTFDLFSSVSLGWLTPFSRFPGVFIWLDSLRYLVGPLWKGLGSSQTVCLCRN